MRGAVLSADGIYRYSLTREFPTLGADRGHVVWLLCNPSTADANDDDHTVRKGRGFSLRWGFSSMEFVNRGAFRARNPKALLAVDDPIGPDNAEHLSAAFARADLIVFAWGRAWPTQLDHLAPIPDVPAMCLGRNTDGSPCHPLTLSYDTALEPWDSRAAIAAITEQAREGA